MNDISNIYADYEVRFGRTGKRRWAEIRKRDGKFGSAEWHRYPIKSAEAMLTFGATCVELSPKQ